MGIEVGLGEEHRQKQKERGGLQCQSGSLQTPPFSSLCFSALQRVSFPQTPPVYWPFCRKKTATLHSSHITPRTGLSPLNRLKLSLKEKSERKRKRKTEKKNRKVLSAPPSFYALIYGLHSLSSIHHKQAKAERKRKKKEAKKKTLMREDFFFLSRSFHAGER